MSVLDPGALFQNNLAPIAILTLGTVQTQQAVMYQRAQSIGIGFK